MRVHRLLPLALASIVAIVSPGAAQTARMSPSDPGASETVGVLSPNEQKRAERARARAASAATTVPAITAAAPGHDRPATRAASAPPPAPRQAARWRVRVADRPVPRRMRAAARDGDPGRPPRVGDVIPPGVPLWAAPPRPVYPSPYRQAEMVSPRGPWVAPAYRPYARPYPPFPRAYDD